MFIPVPALFTAIIVAVIAGLLARARIRAKIRQEKAVSFGFVISAALQSILLIEPGDRTKWFAKKLSVFRSRAIETEVEHLVRAGALLATTRAVLDRNTEGTTAPIDIAGENLRYLGVSATASVAADEAMACARELAKLAVSQCEKSPDTLPLDELYLALIDPGKLASVEKDKLRTWLENRSPWATFLSEVREHGALKYNSQDMISAQLLIEYQILKVYGGAPNELASKFTTSQRKRFTDTFELLERKSYE
jgi:hypothetical protein